MRDHREMREQHDLERYLRICREEARRAQVCAPAHQLAEPHRTDMQTAPRESRYSDPRNDCHRDERKPGDVEERSHGYRH